MTDVCESCIRWSECNGVDADICQKVDRPKRPEDKEDKDAR